MSKKGLTLVEIIITVTIVGILSGLIAYNFLSFGKNIEMQSGSADIISYLRLAQSKAMASFDDKNWGVHLETDKIVLFTGSLYNSSDKTNQIHRFSTGSTISSIQLTPSGSSDIIFKKNSGETDNFGTFSFTYQNSSKIIYIDKNGRISE
jgi:prepilin-type N-terminal cleavage/methylation domain-containing protein